jgi:hypothetical protein
MPNNTFSSMIHKLTMVANKQMQPTPKSGTAYLRRYAPVEETVLYKYRGLSNLQFAIDIFVYKRVHAAAFTSLNDPMEGWYTVEQGALQQWEVNAIFSKKNEYRIVSLSETPTNMLMWSYYADSHAGMVVGVSLRDPAAEVEPVHYVTDLGLERDRPDVAKGILTKKYRMWKHEREHRVFVRNKNFVKVDIHELIFGIGTNLELKKLMTSVATKFCPGVTVRTITRDELDRDEAAGAFSSCARARRR